MTTIGTRRAARNASGGGIYATNQGGLPRPLVGSVVDAHGIEQFGITETAIRRARTGCSHDSAERWRSLPRRFRRRRARRFHLLSLSRRRL